MKFLKVGTRFLLVIVGIIVLTSFSIDATDTLRTSQSALSMFANRVLQEGCPDGTIQIDLAQKSICMDIYENSVGEACDIKKPSEILETKANIDRQKCQSVSHKAMVPWTYVSYHQAKNLCAKRGMRLPSPQEWYEGVLGTPDTDACNVKGNLAAAGNFDKCVSARGVHDGIGNVWEWVDAQVQDGYYDGRLVPESGYVSDIDIAGVALVTAEKGKELYNDDYFWSDPQGVYAMMRGGFFGSGSDAGVYTTHMKVAPSFAGIATGFRCVKDL